MLIIKKAGLGERLGLKAGDIIKKLDGQTAVDLLDYLFYDSQDSFSAEVERNGKILHFQIEKFEGENLELEFCDDNLHEKHCNNKCIFCFVDQLPKGMRSTLLKKDDDYRHSFLFGNFVTLTNLTEFDLERISRLRLSPLYISVHSTDESIRNRMLGRKTGDILSTLEFFEKNRIVLHTQIVLCENINDGENLKKTLKDLNEFSNIASIAVVPVGLTKHRQGLFLISPLSHECIIKTIETVEDFHEKSRISAFCSDEFYLKAGLPCKNFDYYEDFCQIENGVGLIAKFEFEFKEQIISKRKIKYKEFDVATGISAKDIISCCVAKMQKKYGCKINLHILENEYFGKNITVAGLLCGSDFLKIIPKSDILLLPCVCQNEGRFLDGITAEQLSKQLKCKIIFTDSLVL